MTETLEAAAKAPTAYEEAKYIWGDTPGHDALGKQEALYEMVVALAQELADEREIVRGQAETIAELRQQVSSLNIAVVKLACGRSIAQRIADAGAAAMPEATLDAANNWADLRVDLSNSHPEERAGHLDGLDAATKVDLFQTADSIPDFWTIRKDEPADFAGNYPAAAAGETDR